MGKPGICSSSVPVKEKSPEYISSMKKRRRASQARHRLNVATCYQKLKMSIPGLNADFSKRNGRCLNKADLLYRAKEYILHLENSMEKLLSVKRQMTSSTYDGGKDAEDRDKLENEITHFTRIQQFREQFAYNFHVDSNVTSYVNKTSDKTVSQRYRVPSRYKNASLVTNGMNNENLNQLYQWTRKFQPVSQSPTIKSKVSSQQSDDLGFVSGEGGSQDQQNNNNNNTAGSYKNMPSVTFPQQNQMQWNTASSLPPCGIQGTSCAFHSFGSPYVQYPPTLLSTFPDGSFVDPTNLYFYVPTASYPSQFYTSLDDQHAYLTTNRIPSMPTVYDLPGPYHNSSSLVAQSGSFMSRSDQASTSYCDVTLGDVVNDNEEPQIGMGNQNSNTAPPFLEELNASVAEDKIKESRYPEKGKEITVEYEYSKKDGTLDPPKIYLKDKGTSYETKAIVTPQTIVVVEKPDFIADEGISVLPEK